MNPKETIAAFDRFLEARALHLDAVVIGGTALALRTLGRDELLMSKLFALCDRGTDLGDCIALAPSLQELDRIKPWLAMQDAHPGWSDHIDDTLADLRRRLGHGI